MKVRGRFVVALLVLAGALVGTAGFVHLRHRLDARALRFVEQVAHAVHAPSGATPSRECHGDGLVACYVWQVSPRTAATEFAAQLRRAADQQPAVTCLRVQHGVAAGQQSCLVAIRSRGRAAVVSVDPHVLAGASGPRVVGALITVSAA